MASGKFLAPTIFNDPLASLNAPPDFSRNFPIMDPARITIPIYPMVFPNPELTASTTSFNDMVPEKMPKPKATRMSDKKGCHFRTEVEMMINTIDKSNNMISHIT